MTTTTTDNNEKQIVMDALWNEQIGGLKRAKIAVMLLKLINAKGEEGFNVDDILEFAPTVPGTPDVTHISTETDLNKINRVTRNAIIDLTKMGFVYKKGKRYYPGPNA